jgi:hypothetical protein
MPCTPPTVAGQPDPCAADSAGLACNETSDGGPLYFCTVPGQFEACLPTPGPGCGGDPPGLQCEDIPDLDGQVCVQPCTESAECPDIEMACLTFMAGTSICYYDLCGPSSAAFDGGPPSNGTTFYAPCENASSSPLDGLCVPVMFSSGNFGICYAGGSLQAGDVGCTTSRSVATGTSNLCPTGSVCITDTVDLNTLCSPICGYTVTEADGGPPCPGTDSCFGVDEPFGVCLQSCASGQTCPTNTSCQGQVCQP